MALVEHHAIEVGVFDAGIVGQQDHTWIRDLCAPTVVQARAWAAEQGMEIDVHLVDQRGGDGLRHDECRILVTWDVIVGRGTLRHDPERFVDGGSRFLWSSRWRSWLNRFSAQRVQSEIAEDG
ncbi:hypothetical protein SEA_AXUMITE_66 [Gordonia phage Axumite]|nr:hypothetical protein SEA_AXUMITE_66 [Gordonia phage Axumite]